MSNKGFALITGASGGIGYELAKMFAANGHRIALTARSGDRLQEVAAELCAEGGGEARSYPLDLSVPGAADELVGRLAADGVSVAHLVNNAGFGSFGSFAEADYDATVQMIHLNITALTALTRLLLPSMLERKHGGILNVASTAAFQPGPLMATYYATQAYVLSFSEALREELRGSGVTVTALCPGPTYTGFQDRAQMHKSKLFNGLMRVAAAREVARQGYEGFERGKSLVIPGLLNKMIAQSYRFLPRGMIPRMVRAMQEKREELYRA